LEQLDLATVIRVSQALSREVVLDKLVDTIMEASIEHAGAERAVLLQPEWAIEGGSSPAKLCIHRSRPVHSPLRVANQ
jgi:hypothetical protein